MKLYYLPGASSLAAHIVLEWIGAPYTTARMSHDGLRLPAYLARNPAGTVPLLQHDDFALTESVAILGYLADLHPQARLLGDGSPRARAEVMRWLGFLAADVHGAFRPIVGPTRSLAEGAPAGALADQSRQRIRAQLERLDGRLAGRDWLAGTRSIADPYLFVMLRWAVGQDIGLYGLDHLMRFARHMEADAGVRAAILAEEGVLV